MVKLVLIKERDPPNFVCYCLFGSIHNLQHEICKCEVCQEVAQLLFKFCSLNLVVMNITTPLCGMLSLSPQGGSSHVYLCLFIHVEENKYHKSKLTRLAQSQHITLAQCTDYYQ